jgi:hypothetical protein
MTPDPEADQATLVEQANAKAKEAAENAISLQAQITDLLVRLEALERRLAERALAQSQQQAPLFSQAQSLLGKWESQTLQEEDFRG